ncbi:hypothetical protein SAMN04515668_4699 [Hymenobacter arizonensis]|uniref:Uncharacterized protein n=1 Tax=Hymenobacter arizonensis TaxID=1227077 RepID=A0A1I6BKZ9_HYMAR|nr:hypothetical protein SAMN04515668_4699 [Hymenobacter arizonensis]
MNWRVYRAIVSVNEVSLVEPLGRGCGYLLQGPAIVQQGPPGEGGRQEADRSGKLSQRERHGGHVRAAAPDGQAVDGPSEDHLALGASAR